MGEAIGDVTSTVRELGSALTAPEVEARVEPADGLVKAGARLNGDRLVIVAANAGYEPAQATITVPGLNGCPLSIVATGRGVQPDGDSFTERFPPLGVRVLVTRH